MNGWSVIMRLGAVIFSVPRRFREEVCRMLSASCFCDLLSNSMEICLPSTTPQWQPFGSCLLAVFCKINVFFNPTAVGGMGFCPVFCTWRGTVWCFQPVLAIFHPILLPERARRHNFPLEMALLQLNPRQEMPSFH